MTARAAAPAAGEDRIDERRKALRERVASGGPGVSTALEAALRDPDPRLRAEAAYQFGKGRSAGAAQLLQGATGDEAPVVRVMALEALEGLGGDAARPAALRLAADASEDVRAAAARALGRSGGEGADAALRRLAADPVPTVRAAAEEATKRGR